MKKKSIYVLTAASLTMLVPAPGRFVYGMVLVFELIFLMLAGTLADSLAKKIKLNSLGSAFTFLVVISSTVLYRQVMMLFQPEAMFVLGINIYLVPVSLFVIGYLFMDLDLPLAQRLRTNMVHILTFSVYALVFFLVRDIFGYGTFTFFGPKHQIIEKVIIPAEKTGFFSILASVPGALILSGIVVYTHVVIRTKLSIIKKVEESK